MDPSVYNSTVIASMDVHEITLYESVGREKSREENEREEEREEKRGLKTKS